MWFFFITCLVALWFQFLRSTWLYTYFFVIKGIYIPQANATVRIRHMFHIVIFSKRKRGKIKRKMTFIIVQFLFLCIQYNYVKSSSKHGVNARDWLWPMGGGFWLPISRSWINLCGIDFLYIGRIRSNQQKFCLALLDSFARPFFMLGSRCLWSISF